jgi:hypothetical protein
VSPRIFVERLRSRVGMSLILGAIVPQAALSFIEFTSGVTMPHGQ